MDWDIKESDINMDNLVEEDVTRLIAVALHPPQWFRYGGFKQR